MDKFNFDEILKSAEKLKQDLPILLANQAQVFFTETFTKQGWEGTSWKEVQRRIAGTNAYKYPRTKGLTRRTNPILVNTGNLRRAVSNSMRTGSVSFESIRLVVPIEYASYLNDGTPKMDKRQFIGDSPTLRKKQVELITNSMEKIFSPK